MNNYSNLQQSLGSRMILSTRKDWKNWSSLIKMWQILLVCLLVIISIFELMLLYLAQCVFCHCPWSLVHYYFDQMQPHHKYILGCTWFVITNWPHFFNSLTLQFCHISSALSNVHLKTWQCANACKLGDLTMWQCGNMKVWECALWNLAM